MNFLCFQLIIVAFACLSNFASSNDVKFPGQPGHPQKYNGLPKQHTKPPFDLFKSMSRSINRLALLMNYILPKSGVQDENLVFSPLNVFQTLSSLMLGSAGETEKELGNIVGFVAGRYIEKNNKELIHRAFGNFLRNITYEDANRVDDVFSIIMSGGIFIQKDYPVRGWFIENSKNIYNNDVIRLNFEDGNDAATKINQWVSEKTRGKINSIVDPSIDPQTKAIITGTLYFNANWEFPFMVEATKWQKFFLGKDGKLEKSHVMVQFMVNQAKIPYYEDKNRGFSAIGMPYKNKDFYMYIVLPRLGTNVHNVTNCLSPKDIEPIVAKARLSEVFYVIPKMKLDAEYNLRKLLEWVGTKTLFSPTAANFSDMGEGLSVSQVIHKVTVDVNEFGTTAAAATSTSLNRGGYVNFRADRPFFFFVYNVKLGTTIFWAEVNKPTPFK